MGRPGKSRSHSFTGCWTCRRRHVKCDEGVPNCERCTTARLKCEGYGFCFDVPPGVQSSRQRLPPDSRPDLYLRLTNAEIDDYLTDIDSAWQTTHRGPFSLLKLHGGDDVPSDHGSSEGTTDLVRRPRSLATSSTASTSPTSYHDDAASVLHGLFTPSSEKPSKRRRWIPSPSISPSLDFVNVGLTEKRLFNHYMEFVVPDLSPHAGFMCSAYSNVVPAIAIGGSADSDAAAAVYHGLCGIAATSLATVSPGSPEHRLEALRQEKLALHHLRVSIANNTKSYLTLAVAILVLLLGEHLSGRAQHYGAHVQAGLRCLMLAVSAENNYEGTASSIFEQFLLACALGRLVPQTDIGALRTALTDGRSGYFQEQMGVSLGLIDVIMTVNEILMRPGGPRPEEVESLERKLAREHPPDQKSASVKDRIGGLAYHSTALYFARVVWQLPTDAWETQQLVERCLEQLEALETNGREINNCVIVWAAGIIGSECSLQDHRRRFVGWCEAPSVHKVANISIVLTIARMSWMRGKEEAERQGPIWWHTTARRGGAIEVGELDVQYTPAKAGGL